MFTGLVQHVGVVRSVEVSSAGRRVVVDAGSWAHRPSRGSSIAVDGCCLSVAACDGGTIAFDVVPQTLAMTTLGALSPGRRVNLEHALKRNPVDLETNIYMAALHLAAGDKAAAAWKAEEIRVLQPGFSGRRWLETHPLTDPSQKRKLVQALNELGL